MRHSSHGNRSRAFTLVELLVVIGIIAVLISVLLPALSAARKQANTMKCLSHMRQVGIAFKLYANDNRDFWPVARQDYPDKNLGKIGDTLPGPINLYYQDELLKYVSTKGSGVVESATGGQNGGFAEQQRSVLWGCPEWTGRPNLYGSSATSLYVNGVYIYEGGYAMNIYCAYKPTYPKSGTAALASRELAQRSETVWTAGAGIRYKQSQYTMSDRRMLITDSTLWLLYFSPAASALAIGPQPLWGKGLSSGATNTIDRYRHGKYPNAAGDVLDTNGGRSKVAFNILYCDGHAATATDIVEGYRSIRMRNPGN